MADRYAVERELGRGGMATVYLARDLRHKRHVALKVFQPDLSYALGAERFLREIETVASLTHPHVLPLHDSGEAGGLLYYVMPYVEGGTLRDRLTRETQLPVADALQIAREVADALAYAHSRGVIHRDIKPENILLSGEHALVADFGIARALGVAGGQKLTEVGMAVGTAAYVSPEQASGSGVDGRSDIYALGCVLYEMLAGEPPFSGPTAQAIIAKRFTGEVPRVRHVRPSVPESVEQAVIRALAPVAADRFPSPGEFARALEPLTATPPATLGRSAVTETRASRRVPLAATTLVLGILIGLGALFAWRRSHSDPIDASATLLAVLPFENLGDSTDAYFADGVANELRAKLSQIQGLQVIARGSSSEYKGTTKPQQQIAHELGVAYLLTATVQWAKGADGAGRVRVTPELVDVRAGHAPRTRWGQSFDAAIIDVFQVQADIAGQVAQALKIELGDSTKLELAAKPTQNLPAYDAFLRGEAASQGMGEIDPPRLRRAIVAYEQAVALDSSFTRAWAQLARAEAVSYLYGTATPAAAARARRAAERALALAPTKPEGHQALGAYYGQVLADHARALAEDSIALTMVPGSSEVLTAVGIDELSLGRWEAARGHLEHAARLDPRSSTTAEWLGLVFLYTRRHAEAERALDRAVQLAPANLIMREERAMVALARGDVAAARAVINAVPREVDPSTLVAFVANFLDLVWLLDEAQQRLLLRLTPGAFDENRATWGIVLAQAYALRGDKAKARVYADSSRMAYEQLLKEAPDNAQGRVFFGLSLAYLGNKVAAVREGQRAVASLPLSRDAFHGPYVQHQLARIYLLVGEPDKALDQLEPLLKIPYYLSPGWLRVDPTFVPLRGNPRFERLVKKPAPEEV